MNEEQAEENQDSAPTTRVLNEDFPAWKAVPRKPIQSPTGLESAWTAEPKVANIDTTPTPPSESNVAKLTPLNSSTSKRSARSHRREARTLRNNTTTSDSITVDKTRNLEYISPLYKSQYGNSRELEVQDTSAPSGYSPGGSPQELESSENPDSEYIDLEGTFVNLFGHLDDPDDDPEESDDQAPESKPSSPKPKSTPLTSSNTKMASFDAPLEHLITKIAKHGLTDPYPLALSYACVKTFDQFRMIDINDVPLFIYKDPKDPKGATTLPLHLTLIREIQRLVSYCQYLEDSNHADCDDPTLWKYDACREWQRKSYIAFINAKATAALASPTAIAGASAVGSATLPIISAKQKDDDAALVSWNRRPRDVAKYPILKTDDGYPDWKLKMKRQLIADTLQRVTVTDFAIATFCRPGADTELAELQINFFEQILSAVLQNPQRKRPGHH